MELGPQLEPVGRTRVYWQGQELTFIGGNDYHRLSSHPDVISAFTEEARSGINMAGSRITTANHPLYERLENRLASFFGTERAVCCSSGYVSNIMLIQGLEADFTHAFIDQAAHACLVDAVKQSGLKPLVFRHSDAEHLRQLMQQELSADDRPLIVCDAVFSSSGEIPPVIELQNLAQEFGGMLLLDDAHGVGVIGQTGRGVVEEFNLNRNIVIQTGTLSKGFGTYGGFVVGSDEIIDKVMSRSRLFVGNTPLPTPYLAASICAIDLLDSNLSLVSKLRSRVTEIKSELNEMGFPQFDSPASILSLTLRDDDLNKKWFQIFLSHGVYPPFIDYPGAPPGGHFRFTPSSCHSDEELSSLMLAVSDGIGLKAGGS